LVVCNRQTAGTLLIAAAPLHLMLVYAADVLMATIKQQPQISLRSLEFAVRGSSTWFTPAFLEFKTQEQRFLAAAQQARTSSSSSSSSSSNGGGSSSIDAVMFQQSRVEVLPTTHNLAISSADVCHSLVSNVTTGKELTLLLSGEIASLLTSCMKLTRAATDVCKEEGFDLTSVGARSSSSSGGGGGGGSSRSSGGNFVGLAVDAADSAQRMVAAMALAVGMHILHDQSDAAQPAVQLAAAVLRNSVAQGLADVSSFYRSAAAMCDWSCRGLMLVAHSLCSLGDAFMLLGSKQQASNAAAAIAGAAARGAAAAARGAAAAARGAAAAAAAADSDALTTPPTAVVQHSAVEPTHVLQACDSEGVEITLDCLQRNIEYLAEDWPEVGPMLSIAAAMEADQQQQQLGKDIQELLACLPAVKAAVESTSVSAAALESSAAAAAPHSSSSSRNVGSNYRSSSSSCAAALPEATITLLVDLGQRLVRCGEALAALCPVPLCCNNSSCVELRGSSERELVGGKGTLCSICRCVGG
jgi:hypothetical protein